MWNFCIGFARKKKTHLPLYSPYIASLIFDGYELEINRFYETITYPEGKTCHNSYDNIYDTSKGIPEEIQQMAIPRFDTVEKKTPQSIPHSKEYLYYNQCMKPLYNFCNAFAQRNNLVFIALEDVFDLDRPITEKSMQKWHMRLKKKSSP